MAQCFAQILFLTTLLFIQMAFAQESSFDRELQSAFLDFKSDFLQASQKSDWLIPPRIKAPRERRRLKEKYLKAISKIELIENDYACDHPAHRRDYLIADVKDGGKIYFCHLRLNKLCTHLQSIGFTEEQIADIQRNIFLHEFLHFFGYDHGPEMIAEHDRLTKAWGVFKNYLSNDVVKGEIEWGGEFEIIFKKLLEDTYRKFPDQGEVIKEAFKEAFRI